MYFEMFSEILIHHHKQQYVSILLPLPLCINIFFNFLNRSPCPNFSEQLCFFSDIIH